MNERPAPNAKRMRPIPAVPAFLLALLLAADAQAQVPVDRAAALAKTRAAYDAALIAAGPVAVGLLEPLDLRHRLADDADALAAERPSDWPAADWEEMRTTLVALDVELAEQLQGLPRTFALLPGLHAQLLRSAVDGTIDSVTTYVPAGATEPRSVALVLHGNPQTDTELLAQPYLRRLADETGTILVAPHGRGAYNYLGPATRDVYGIAVLLHDLPALHAARFYLAGYSMGGFSVFRLGPDAPVAWNAVLAISGSLVGSAAPRVLARWRATPVYVVFGDRDASIPTQFGRDTARYLLEQSLPVGYYEQERGTHRLATLYPALHAAWLDMQRGVTRTGGIELGSRAFAGPPPQPHLGPAQHY